MEYSCRIVLSEYVTDSKLTVPGSCFGSGQIVIQRWWLLQICAVQGAAYREMEAGICSRIDNRAYPIIINKGGDIKMIVEPFNNTWLPIQNKM